MDQLVWYIVHFANAVKLYQRKNGNVSDVVVLTISRKIVWRILAGPPKSEFKCKIGNNEEGRPGPSETSSHSTSVPGWGSQGLKTSLKVPFFNPDLLTQWSGPENIAQVRIDGESSWDLLDSGLTINVVTPEFVEACSLDIDPLSDLANGTLGINGFRGVYIKPLGYIIIRVEVEGVWGYNEDQVALVIPDSTIFGSRVAGYSWYTHHQLNHEYDQRKWNQWVVGFLEWIECGPVVDMSFDLERSCHTPTVHPYNLKEPVKMTKKEEIDAFSSKIYMAKEKPCSWKTTCM